MLTKLLKGLFSSTPAATEDKPDDAVEHEGYRIIVAPMRNGSQWQIAGRIEREIDGETRSHTFIRADTMSSRDEAAEHTLRKARLLIDQQGDAIFG